MPSQVEDISEEPPTSINPYEVLCIGEKATADQIRYAYRRQALAHHPDKAPPNAKDAAKSKFQEIAFAYAILSDERRRKRYDVTGNTSESIDLDDDNFNWTDFFREQYASTISLEILERTKREYQGSDEEKQHLLAAYQNYRGDLNKIYEVIMMSNPLDDEGRICAILDKAIKDGEIQPLKKYTEEPKKRKEKRMADARKEAEEAEQELKEMDSKSNKKGSTKMASKKSDDADLVALIQQRQKSRAANFLDSLEAKYAGGNKGSLGKRSKKRDSEPSDEAFAEARARSGKKNKTAEDEGSAKRSAKSKS